MSACHSAFNIPLQSQKQVLLELLEKQKVTVYGKDHGFGAISNVDEFRKRHPLTRYRHYEPYVVRVYKGEENVMTSSTPKILAMTSGTSGQSSMLPSTNEVSQLFFKKGILVIYDLINKHFPESKNLQKNLKLVCMPRFGKSPSGIRVGPNSSNPKDMNRYDFMYSTPMAVYDLLTEPETIYLHLLFALCDKNLGMIEANFAHLVYIAMQHLKEKWPQLVSDIRLGKIDPDLKIDQSVRRKLENQLVANPARASELHAEFLHGFDGIVQRIWPNLYCVLCVDTGTYVNALYVVTTTRSMMFITTYSSRV